MSTRFLSAAALAMWALSCSPANNTADGGADGGTQTVGDQCSQIALAFCTQAIGSCGFPDTLSDCIDNEMPTCCVGSACNAISRTPPTALAACTSALSTEDCNSVVNVGASGVSECMGVPQAP